MALSFPNNLKKINPTQSQPVANRLLALEHVSFGYSPSQPLLRQFNWELREGESWSILGPSGCGKTTLLYLLAGLRKPTSGKVRFNGGLVNGTNPQVGLMLQDYGLLPWYTAQQNVELGLRIRQIPRQQRQAAAAKWLNRLAIAEVADQYPNQLSGGQRQRVALARLLSLGTKVLLLDEPFSAVDEMTRERLQRLLLELRHDLQATTVLVTHSVEEAALLGDNIMIITGYAPIEAVTILPSPFAGTHPKRSDPHFMNFCSQIREVLEL
jgi:NitT/TauT family transport system ATP-binding protein